RESALGRSLSVGCAGKQRGGVRRSCRNRRASPAAATPPRDSRGREDAAARRKMFSRTHFCLPPQDDGFAYAFLDRPFVAHQQQLQVGGVGGVPAAAGHALFNPAAILAPAGPQHSPAVGKPPPRGPASYRYEKPLSSFDQELTIWIDHPVASMSISPSSRDVVLASYVSPFALPSKLTVIQGGRPSPGPRRGLIIIDLENPYEPPRILTYVTRWEVADVQWNPHRAREDWRKASTAKIFFPALPRTHPAELTRTHYFCGTIGLPVEEILHGHDRAISDVNWSPHVPEVLATCSVDAYVHLWDL
ncbi:MAG: hypothetical protein BJ554DRAFT_1876, partial [Olpidium bornovanus]